MFLINIVRKFVLLQAYRLGFNIHDYKYTAWQDSFCLRSCVLPIQVTDRYEPTPFHSTHHGISLVISHLQETVYAPILPPYYI